ncbi:hypothetical protein ACSDQ9_09310 [Aestuariimicrobium soli]|uniref:hypothetical protein n=1 Tax=Aestuariimicrobium soli TaxID=2035834 RepID=UPI003EBEB4C4
MGRRTRAGADDGERDFAPEPARRLLARPNKGGGASPRAGSGGDEAAEGEAPLAPGTRRRLVVGTLAAVLVLVAALTLPSLVGRSTRDDSAPDPNRPTASTLPTVLPTADWTRRVGTGDPFDAGPLVVTSGDTVVVRVQLLEQVRDGLGIVACVSPRGGQTGTVGDSSFPPGCSGYPAPALTWEQVEGADVAVHSSATAGGVRWTDEVALVAVFADDTLRVEAVFADPTDAPWPETGQVGNGLNFDALCVPSHQRVTKGSLVAAQHAAESLPDYQFLFVADSTLNVVVTQDVVRAREVIEQQFTGPLCVGQGQGLPAPRLQQAERAVTRLDGVVDAMIVPENQGAALEVTVIALTPDLHGRIVAAVGADVSQWLIIRADLQPVG